MVEVGAPRVSPPNSWYYAIDRTPYGPVDIARIRQMISQGELGPDYWVKKEGEQNWTTVGMRAEFVPPENPKNIAPVAVWYYAIEGTPYGPVDITHIRQMLSQGKLGPAYWVKKEGEQNWTTAWTRTELVPPSNLKNIVLVAVALTAIVVLTTVALSVAGGPSFDCVGGNARTCIRERTQEFCRGRGHDRDYHNCVGANEQLCRLACGDRGLDDVDECRLEEAICYADGGGQIECNSRYLDCRD